jgi:hypothetical protein
VITSPFAGGSTEPNQITVAWTAAAANGSTITGYTVQAQIAPGGAITNVTVPGTVTSTTITGLLNCTAYDLTVIATSGGGSTESDPVQGVTPRQAPDVPSGLSLAKVPDSVGELLLSWLPSDPRGCGAVSYVVETTRPGPIVTAGSAGSATSFDYSETDPGAIAACPYPDVDCNTPRTWSFRVQASNAGGASAFSGAISGTPRLGYVRDNLYVVWATPLTGSNGTFACTACHGATNVLNLGDGADTTHNTSWSNIRTTPNVAIVTPSPSPATSLLHLCPTQSPGCTGTRLNGTAFTAHPGGQRYPAGSKEDALIVQWILDGALF